MKRRNHTNYVLEEHKDTTQSGQTSRTGLEFPNWSFVSQTKGFHLSSQRDLISQTRDLISRTRVLIFRTRG